MSEAMERAALFDRDGLLHMAAAIPASLATFLRSQRDRLAAVDARPRPWQYRQVHNPWSPAATLFDSWGLLDFCQSPALLNLVSELLGPDVILYESQWLPDPWATDLEIAELDSDAHLLPVAPPAGLTVLVPCTDGPMDTLSVRYLEASHRDDEAAAHGRATHRGVAAKELKLAAGDVFLLNPRLRYRIHPAAGTPQVYAIRYFPASSTYLRDASAEVHRVLTLRYPLINYARVPLWLVRGEDRADNDFVTGFSARPGYWTQAGR